ncbi:integrator complex subunit 6 homolog [Penaeus japonicus]|uniref:integrator complex subunit 6 homolog n=1 Tax=Penaeus japonicus TaxID=27405 RepID=UPI001C715C52|nr:integrator complex subunit 6 homolog [Penaeus japonicus]
MRRAGTVAIGRALRSWELHSLFSSTKRLETRPAISRPHETALRSGPSPPRSPTAPTKLFSGRGRFRLLFSNIPIPSSPSRPGTQVPRDTDPEGVKGGYDDKETETPSGDTALSLVTKHDNSQSFLVGKEKISSTDDTMSLMVSNGGSSEKKELIDDTSINNDQSLKTDNNIKKKSSEMIKVNSNDIKVNEEINNADLDREWRSLEDRYEREEEIISFVEEGKVVQDDDDNDHHHSHNYYHNTKKQDTIGDEHELQDGVEDGKDKSEKFLDSIFKKDKKTEGSLTHLKEYDKSMQNKSRRGSGSSSRNTSDSYSNDSNSHSSSESDNIDDSDKSTSTASVSITYDTTRGKRESRGHVTQTPPSAVSRHAAQPHEGKAPPADIPPPSSPADATPQNMAHLTAVDWPLARNPTGQRDSLERKHSKHRRNSCVTARRIKLKNGARRHTTNINNSPPPPPPPEPE